jgi:hypothetical protein
MKYLNIFFKIPTVIMIGVSPGDVWFLLRMFFAQILVWATKHFCSERTARSGMDADWRLHVAWR